MRRVTWVEWYCWWTILHHLLTWYINVHLLKSGSPVSICLQFLNHTNWSRVAPLSPRSWVGFLIAGTTWVCSVLITISILTDSSLDPAIGSPRCHEWICIIWLKFAMVVVFWYDLIIFWRTYSFTRFLHLWNMVWKCWDFSTAEL